MVDWKKQRLWCQKKRSQLKYTGTVPTCIFQLAVLMFILLPRSDGSVSRRLKKLDLIRIRIRNTAINCKERLILRLLFQNPVNLQIHRMSHRGIDKHECPECREEFATWQKCCLHLWREHGQDLELYSCESCDYRSFTAAVMEKHKLSHSDQRAFLCPDCGRAYKIKSQLQEHMKSVHRKVSPEDPSPDDEGSPLQVNTCSICNKTFATAREVRYHKERVHDKMKPWSCHQCGYAAFSHKTLRLHIRSHTGSKPYACTECEFKTGDHNSLRRHSMRHSGERPYKCPHCPYAAIQSNCFKIHLRNKHPDHAESTPVYECSQCSFTTHIERMFLDHAVAHTKEKQSAVQISIFILLINLKEDANRYYVPYLYRYLFSGVGTFSVGTEIHLRKCHTILISIF